MYETHYYKSQPYFGEKIIQLHYMDTDSFLIKVNTKDIIKDLQNLDDLFDFSSLCENYDLFSNKNREVIVKFKTRTPENVWIDDLFV